MLHYQLDGTRLKKTQGCQMKPSSRDALGDGPSDVEMDPTVK